MITHPHTAGEIAEQKVQEKLRDLPAGYDVIENVDIVNRNRKSEVDIVVVTPTSVVVLLEVKAGSVEPDEDGQYIRSYAGGNQTDIIKQSSRQRSILSSRLASLPGHIHVVSFLVLPTGYLEGDGVGFNAASVIDADRFDDLCEIIRQCNFKASVGVDRDKLVGFLKNKCTVKQSVSSISQTLDQRCRDLASGLATWVPRIESPLAVVEVEAPAGAGKTQLALALLEKAHAQNRKAWYINTTRNIAERMQDDPVNAHVDFIGTWHELALEMTKSPDPADVTNEERPALFEAASNAFIEKLQTGAFAIDTIILDDAQDLKPEYTEALLGAISETGTLYVLSDPMSRRGEKIEFSESVKISTDETVRVPQEVVILMNRLKLTQTPLTSASPYQGEMPSCHIYKSETSLVKQTQDAVNKAREEGFTNEQIVILSMKSVADSVLLKSDTLGDNNRYTLKHVTDKFKNGRQVFSEGAIWHDTVRRFKGLQAPFVILTEMDFTEFDEKAAALLYLGMTRASMGLALVMSEDATKAFIGRLD